MINLNEFTQNSEFKCYTHYDDLPMSLVSEVGSGKGNDGISLLRYGKEWAFEFAQQFQPKTTDLLMNGSKLVLGHRNSWAGPIIVVVLEVNGQLVEICRQRLGSNPCDIASEKQKYAWERSLSLPKSIQQAYYCRIDGMNIPDSVAFGPFTKILPYPIQRPWQSIDGYLGDLRLKKKFLPIVEEMIPGIKPEESDMPYNNFMMFLNSWGSFTGKKRTDGDHLFVKNHLQDGIVYYVRDADIEKMMILANPAEAIDQYCAHILSRRDGRFDFMPWSVSLY